MRRIEELQQGREGSYLFPFMWMKGESEAQILEEMDRIGECGIRQICLESRIHPDFLGEGWWRNLDFILKEAAGRDMKVWILDDRRFPTGWANGAFCTQPERAKIYLAEVHVDVLGPAQDNMILLQPLISEAEEVLGIWMYPRNHPESSVLCLEDGINLTDAYQNGAVITDIPPGLHRVVVYFTSRKGGGKEHYINLVDQASVRVLIDTVYEPHYQHYKNLFGKVFAGFFSDEPELGNVDGCTFLEMPGKEGRRLPWSTALGDQLAQRWGAFYTKYLAALWYEVESQSEQLRYDYMDVVSRLVKICFSDQLGRWCQERGIAHVGHVIEDNNAHGGLGCGTAHYFRSQSSQQMAGIDVVSQQILPGFTGNIHRWLAAEGDGEFFHFGLAKLGASEAHLNPEKEGRAFCELFGAYGWGEGVPLMKWLIDHMLVRGINYFVPHAFSMQFPDDDCPPHFYAQGNNPQFPYFAELMVYANRLCHLFNGGIHEAEALVVYHPEAEWGGAETMPDQKVIRKLVEQQLDCDIFPTDYANQVQFKDGRMCLNGNAWKALIFPYCSWIPEHFADLALCAAAAEVPVYWIDGYPDKIGGGDEILLERLKEQTKVAALEQIGDRICELGGKSFPSMNRHEGLRSYTYRHEDGKVLFLMNEDKESEIDVQISLAANQGGRHVTAFWYQAQSNQVLAIGNHQGLKGTPWIQNGMLRMCLAPGASACILVLDETALMKKGTADDGWIPRGQYSKMKWCVTGREMGKAEKAFQVSLSEEDAFEALVKTYPFFSGECIYQTEILEKFDRKERYVLELPGLSDCAEVCVNGNLVGKVLGAPFHIELTGLLNREKNKLEIRTAGTLVWCMRDRRSARMQLKSYGLTQRPYIQIYGRDGSRYE